MIYGENKSRHMCREGLERDTHRHYNNHGRATVRATLHRYILGDEDADITFDADRFSRRNDRDRNSFCSNAFRTWAMRASADVADPALRFKKVLGFANKPSTRYCIQRGASHAPAFRPQSGAKVFDWDARRKARYDHLSQVLREIVISGWGHSLLNSKIRHTTVVWDDRVARGPRSARKLLGLGDVQDFLQDLYAAASSPVVNVEPYMVRSVQPTRYWYGSESIPRHTYVREYEWTTRTNPDYHPEWLDSVSAFVQRWEAGEVELPECDG